MCSGAKGKGQPGTRNMEELKGKKRLMIADKSLPGLIDGYITIDKEKI